MRRQRRPYRDHREDRSAGLCHARYAEFADIGQSFRSGIRGPVGMSAIIKIAD